MSEWLVRPRPLPGIIHRPIKRAHPSLTYGHRWGDTCSTYPSQVAVLLTGSLTHTGRKMCTAEPNSCLGSMPVYGAPMLKRGIDSSFPTPVQPESSRPAWPARGIHQMDGTPGPRKVSSRRTWRCWPRHLVSLSQG